MFKLFAPAALAIALIAAFQPAQSRPSDEEVGRHVMAEALATFLHELGHGLIAELKLPATGLEEDAADEFSTMILLAVAQEDAIGHDAALASAQAFLDIWEFRKAQNGDTVDALPFWDEHGLDFKRAANILCLMYGSDPQRFAALAEATNMEAKQKEWLCQQTYERKAAAWETLLAPHLWPEGTQPPADAPRFTVTYGEANSEAARGLEAVLKQNRVYEQLAEALSGAIRLPRPITIVLKECGEPNAFWHSKTQSITMCYEWMQFIGELYIARAEGQIGTVGRAVPDGAGALAGVWRGQGTDMMGMPAALETVLQPNGEFTQSMQSMSGVNLRIWGRWTADASAIDFRIVGWDPKQFCGPLGCSPVTLGGGERVPYRMLDANTLQSGPVTFYRVR
jgi:hypothetical protein